MGVERTFPREDKERRRTPSPTTPETLAETPQMPVSAEAGTANRFKNSPSYSKKENARDHWVCTINNEGALIKKYKGHSRRFDPEATRPSRGRRPKSANVDQMVRDSVHSATDTRNTLPRELDTTDTHNRRPKCQEGRH